MIHVLYCIFFFFDQPKYYKNIYILKKSQKEEFEYPVKTLKKKKKRGVQMAGIRFFFLFLRFLFCLFVLLDEYELEWSLLVCFDSCFFFFFDVINDW